MDLHRLLLEPNQNPLFFDFALEKTPTSRAKNAREMGHPILFCL